jgi:TRAP-type C4-dicarboxylate transport system substrate-binding protein
MRETHIPDVMSTGMFLSYRMSRLLGHEHQDSEIFSVQYLVRDMAHLRRYQEEFAPALQQETKARYDGKFAVFRTVMDLVDHNEQS